MKKVIILSMLVILLFVGIPSQVSAQPIDFEYQCDVVENNPNSFFSDDMIWNEITRMWDPPMYYQLYWNGTGLDAPLLEYQMRSFNFTVSSIYNTTKSAVVYGNFYPSPYGFMGAWEDYYVNHSYWLGTNGVVHNSTGPYQTTEDITGTVENFMWNTSGWYKLGIFGSYYDPYYGCSMSYFEMFFFYLNITEAVEEVAVTEPATTAIKTGIVEVVSDIEPVYDSSEVLVGFVEATIQVLVGVWNTIISFLSWMV